MTKLLYFRLALTNLWKNRQTYFPFLLASTLLTFTQYSFLMIAFNPGLSKVHGGMQFQVILTLGIVVVSLFAAIFLFYANGFLIKRRKKEMGLYSILGMEKKHIARVLFHELTLTYGFSMALGIGLGILLGRLMFLLIRLAIRIEVPLVGSVNPLAVWITLGLFAVLFLLLILFNTWQVRSVDPVELLRGGRTGEREPKARWFLAILGVVTMGTGYWMAQRVQNPMAAIALFLIAVVLVIVGTYLMFLSGSIALLKLLKRNKRYYYSSRHFVTVSGMLYRMKQNAAGLASIAILCTMAMITIGTTVGLYNGSEKMLSEYYPSDVQVAFADEASQRDAQELNAAVARQSGVIVTDAYAFHGYETVFAIDRDLLLPTSALSYNSMDDYGKMHDALLLTQESWAALEGETLNLGPNELGVWTTATEKPASLTVGSRQFSLRYLPSLRVVPCMSTGSAITKSYIVVPDDSAIQVILDAAQASAADRAPLFTLQWNLLGDASTLERYYAAFQTQAPDWKDHSLRIKGNLREEWYGMYGGFLFIGIFLGFIFLMGTALILYFKQISEGYQDHDRFIILQQVGMSNEEVRATVRRQILLVFYLPLAVAVCHVAGSLHMMILMLRLFGLMDVPFIAINTFAAALGVALFYWLFYHQTAKTYYRMVKF